MRRCISEVDVGGGLGGAVFLGASAVIFVVIVEAVVGITGAAACGLDGWRHGDVVDNRRVECVFLVC